MEFNFRDLRAETKGWEFLGWKKNQLFFFFFSFETSGTRERVRSLFRSCMERWSATTCHEIAISNQLSLSLSFRGSRENNIEISVVCKHDDCDADASRPARNRKHQLGQSMANVRSSPHVFFFFLLFLSLLLLLSSVFSFPSHSPLLRRFFPRADRIWLDSTGGEWNESPRRFSDRFFAPLDRLLPSPNSVDKRVSSGRRREHSSTFYRRVFIRPRCTQRTSNRARVEMKEKRNK